MATSVSVLETRLKSFMQSCQSFQLEAADLYKLYWSQVSPDAGYTALASGDAATKSSKLTKAEVISGLTFAEQIDRFFTNQSLTQSDYQLTLNAVIYGNDEKAVALSVAIEAFGDRLVAFCQDALELFKQAKDNLDLYNDSEISGAVGGVSGTGLPFYDFTKNELTIAINLISGLKKLINNESLSGVQADYSSTVAVWRHLV